MLYLKDYYTLHIHYIWLYMLGLHVAKLDNAYCQLAHVKCDVKYFI